MTNDSTPAGTPDRKDGQRPPKFLEREPAIVLGKLQTEEERRLAAEFEKLLKA
jgi:hypothetical protein